MLRYAGALATHDFFSHLRCSSCACSKSTQVSVGAKYTAASGAAYAQSRFSDLSRASSWSVRDTKFRVYKEFGFRV